MIMQVCGELGVEIIKGVLLKDHIHMFVNIPQKISVSDFVRRAKLGKIFLGERLF